jgi:hypothetical protein
MSLFSATLLTAILLIVSSFFFFLRSAWIEHEFPKYFHSNIAAAILFGAGSIWFLTKITQLGLADFGNMKRWLFIFFAVIAILTWIFLKEYLWVRGAAILGLLFSNELLKAAYMQSPSTRLLLVVFAYALICSCLYFGVLPFKLRNMVHWLIQQKHRIKVFANILAGYGALLLIASFTY